MIPRKFSTKVNEILRANDKIWKAAESEAFGYIKQLEREVREAMIGARGYDLGHLRAIQDEIKAAGDRLRGGMTQSFDKSQDKIWQLGADLSPAAFGSIGLGMTLPVLSDELLKTVKDYTADLITNMALETIADISGDLRRGIISGENPFKTMERISNKLFTKGEGTFWRAETIVRTESSRVFNIANQERLEQMKERIPDLRKTWATAEDERVRDDHRTAGEDYAPGGSPGPIPVDEPFLLGPEREKADFPADPGLSPQQAVNCRCSSEPFREEWQEK